ncbi:cytochrome P450 [Coprinopsis sp. MPI-PUGE-AT-0042]|nr:cytochrome P450 [Coprinopsis sp. MPI-PUGE-AT-0042]
MSYGPLWRAHRRMFHQYYNKTQIHKYSPVVEQQMSNFIRRLNSEPHNFLEHTQHLFGAIIIQISYGFNKPSQIESLSHAAETIVHTFADCATPGYFLVDVFPILRLVPEWFPGAAWKRRLLGVGKVSQDLFRSTFDDALEQARVSDPGEAQDVAAKIIAQPSPPRPPRLRSTGTAWKGNSTRCILCAAATAGADTTVSSAHTLFVALANHPECQHAAQEELDATIGSDRLPAVADLPHLPYIQALVKELSRWFSVAPMARTTHMKDTSFPRGRQLWANSWAIMHDPEIFEDPLEFKPERYLMRDPVTHQTKINPDVLDPESAAFGYGRRICPGRHLSNEALTLMTASLLSVFNVNAPKDPVSGLPIEVELKIGNGLLSSPAPFEVEIVPRSARHAALVLRED